MGITKKPVKELKELKEQIEECKRVVKDLDLLHEGMSKYGIVLNKGASVVLGLSIMYASKFDKLDAMIKALEDQLPPAVEDPREIA